MNLQNIFDSDDRIDNIVEYPNGFVPNSYRYKCIRTRYRTFRNGERREETYDAKRSYGRGPRVVAFSKAGGRLKSF